MSTAQRNAMLLAALVAGLLSLPTTWLSIRSTHIQITPNVGGQLFTPGADFSNALSTVTEHTYVDLTGLNGHVTLLWKVPIWLIAAIAMAACAFQLADSFSTFDFPRQVLWGIASVAVVLAASPVVVGLISGRATPGVGWLLGFMCAAIPLMTLWLHRPNRGYADQTTLHRTLSTTA